MESSQLEQKTEMSITTGNQQITQTMVMNNLLEFVEKPDEAVEK